MLRKLPFSKIPFSGFRKTMMNSRPSLFFSINKKSKYNSSNVVQIPGDSIQQSTDVQFGSNSLNENIGVIGFGQMSGALVQGFLSSGVTEPQKLYVSEKFKSKREVLQVQYGITNIIGDSLQEDQKLANMMDFSDIVLIGVKPQNIDNVLQKIATKIQERHLVISIAAGITLEKLQMSLGQKARIIRVMPNTPCLVGNGVAAYALGKNATKSDKQIVQKLLSEVGLAIQIEESQIHAIIGVSGSCPAYIFMMIEAIADGGVKAGLSRQDSLRLAATTVQGAAKMVLDSDKKGITHPGVLKDRVASPGGTTIAAIQKLQQLGMRNAFMQAVKAASEHSKQMEESQKGRTG